MGAKLSKKKKGYDVSDPKEKKDEETTPVTAVAECEAQSSEQAASGGAPEEGAKTEAAADISAEPAGEVASMSQTVTSSEAPVTEAAKGETNTTQVETATVTEPSDPALQEPLLEPKAEEPSTESQPEAKLEESLPAKEDPALIKAEETLATPKVVTHEAQATPATECQVVQEALSAAKVAAPVTEYLPADSSTVMAMKNVDPCPVASLPGSGTGIQPEEATGETVTMVQESATKSESAVQSAQNTSNSDYITVSGTVHPKEVTTMKIAEIQESTSKPENAVHSEESTVKTLEVSAVQESTSEPESASQLEESTVKTLELSAIQESIPEPESAVHPEESTIKTLEASAIQESSSEAETAVQCEESVAKTVEVATVQESCIKPETVLQPEDTVTETVAVATIPDAIAEVNHTSDAVTDLIQEDKMQTKTPEPAQTEVPQEVLQKSAAHVTEDSMADCKETQAEAEVEAEPAESSSALEEHTEPTPCVQAEVPCISLYLRETEAVPDIVISESLSANEFHRDGAEESVAEVEHAVELKKVPITIPEAGSETCKPEPALPSAALVGAEVSVAPDEDVTVQTAGSSTQADDAKLENLECRIADSTEKKERPPSSEFNGELQAPKVVLEKSAEPQKEECVNGIGTPDVSPKEQQVISDCELKKDLIGNVEVPESTGEMAEAINASATQDVDLV